MSDYTEEDLRLARGLCARVRKMASSKQEAEACQAEYGGDPHDCVPAVYWPVAWLAAFRAEARREEKTRAEDAEDVADAERTRALWVSRTDSVGADKGFVKFVQHSAPAEPSKPEGA